MAGLAGRARTPSLGLGWGWGCVIALGLYRLSPLSSPMGTSGGSPGAGGAFVAGSLAWGMVMDGFKPDRYDIAGALICLIGVMMICTHHA